MIVEVVPEIRTHGGNGVFSYKVSEELSDQIQIGAIVEIPFGKNKIKGVVKIIQKSKFKSQNYNSKFKIKKIIAINSKFVIPEKYIELAKWVSQYYLCSLGEAIAMFLPPDMKNPRIKNLVPGSGNKKLNSLTTDQKSIYEKLAKNLTSDKKKPALVYGVTGSGKTEIYLHLAKKTIELGKSVVLLVPEIVLTPQNIERFMEIFGHDVVLMHSGLSKSEKFHCYKSFYSGEKKIIVGPRSALLVPNENIGLIIIDEEQEDSYKQEQNPRYDAVALAEKLSEKFNALLVLGSATPRVETYYKAKTGIYDLYTMSGRYNSLMLPVAEIIDLKDEIKKENFSPISEKLQESISAVLKKKEQALLFLNRRGMSTFVSCRDCGFVVTCDRCEIPMIHHLNQSGNYLICHHCEKKLPIPSKCPECGSFRIKYFGSGVEKIEQEIARLFPKARIKRVDAKVLQNHAQYEQFYRDFRDHEFDIVIGTQILAKGFDIPGVSLVGIISADVGLHMPHFRAAEKIFRLITQVSGRSGRRQKLGQTIIQTYWPNSAAIKYAALHDFEGFYNVEIEKRLKKNYPPASHIIRVLSEDRNQNRARENIEKLAKELRAILSFPRRRESTISGSPDLVLPSEDDNLEYIGPGACFFQRLNNKYRYQIIIKVKKLPDKNISFLFSQFPKFTWDVDALNLL
ncbi:MAG: primosomal protein N' [Candidatus Berkelbacteria bacterium]|nr:primosomal protein N' [Candidatus Berkelbacteria bacterium]